MDNPTQEIHPDLQIVFEKHHWVFEKPKGLPPSQGEHDRGIPLIPRIQPPNYVLIATLLHKRIQ
jgi:hypothetical protein